MFSWKCIKRFRLCGIGVLSLLLVFSSFAYASELDEIRNAIIQKGAEWVAGETSISKLPPEERKMRLGAIKPQVTGEEYLISPIPSVSLPNSFDWRNNNGNFVTPIRDQGNCGSCWAFATTGALESKVLITTSHPDVDLDLSEQIVVSCSGAGSCDGGYAEGASNFLRDTGTALESCYPYTATDGNCANACANWQNDTYKISSWNYVCIIFPTVAAIKNALYSNGPLPTTMDVYTDFFYYTGGVYSYTYGDLEGGHVILIVGYNDAGQYFIVKNSWGTGWGESGYFKIAYSQLDNDVDFGDWTLAYGGTVLEENTIPITYTGTWNKFTCSSCSGGSLKYSDQTGAKADFTFNGTGIKWIVTKANILGKAKVYLDGGYMGLVDLYSPTTQWQAVLQKTGLAPGTHTGTIEVSGEKNSVSTGYYIDIDAFEVMP